MVTRYLCSCQAFVELQRQSTNAAQSLTLKYTSLPPQLVLMRALRSNHLTLAAVSLNALLINVLSVAPSNLFSPITQNLTTSGDLSSHYHPLLQIPTGAYPIISPLDGGELEDSFFIAGSGLVESPAVAYINNFTTPDIYYTAKSYVYDMGELPLWTTDEYLFTPFDATTSYTATITSFETSAIGFRSRLHCDDPKSLPGYALSFRLINGSYTDGKQERQTVGMLPRNVTLDYESETPTVCSTIDNRFSFAGRVEASGQTTREIVQLLHSYQANSSNMTERLYINHFLFGWVRADVITNVYWSDIYGYGNAFVTENSYSMLLCHQEMEAYDFNVTVSPHG